jgi:phage/plasmid-like protein (TIGR03299 family)
MALKMTSLYSANAPWDGVGADTSNAKTVKQIMKLAGCDWEVQKRQMKDAEDDTLIENHFQLRRSDNKKVLDVCGNRYKPTQNADIFDFCDQYIKAGKGKIATAGTLIGGQLVWALLDLNVSFDVGNKADKVRGYIFVGSPHKQGKSLHIRVTSKRDVCNNTFHVAMRKGIHGIGDSFTMNHRNEFSPVQQDKAKNTIEQAREDIMRFGTSANKLKKIKIDRERFIKHLAPIFQPQTDVSDLLKNDELLAPKMRELLQINEQAPGADPTTAWGALNAVTYFADHVASRSADRRLQHAWLGRTAKQKQEAYAALITA